LKSYIRSSVSVAIRDQEFRKEEEVPEKDGQESSDSHSMLTKARNSSQRRLGSSKDANHSSSKTLQRKSSYRNSKEEEHSEKPCFKCLLQAKYDSRNESRHRHYEWQIKHYG
jgi:hypothetical protein